MIARREFIGLCGGLFAAWPYAAEALQSGKIPTIAYLGPSTPALDSYRLPAFMQRLRELGWIQGRTLAIEYRWAEGRDDHLAQIAAELRTQYALGYYPTNTAHDGHYRRIQVRASRKDVVIRARPGYRDAAPTSPEAQRNK